MTAKETAIAAIVSQFHHPRGAVGSAAGPAMAHRPSNRRRNRWVVSLLGVQHGDRILEIGFGPGLAIAELARPTGESGHVCGIDHSEVMLRQAYRRNRAAIAAGRVTLSRASIDHLPPSLGGPFDVILTVNSFGFWPAPSDRFEELRRRLTPGGRVAVASQPRCPGATPSTSLRAAQEIEELLRHAGYAVMRTETLDLAPPVVCVLASNVDPPVVMDA
jgi:ubiquinone/menaquinone biosynthesis C-methylase UbiE